MVLVPDHKSSEVAQPGEQALHFPASLVPTQRSSSLGLGFLAIASVRRNRVKPATLTARDRQSDTTAYKP